jgi:hypothetical protein
MAIFEVTGGKQLKGDIIPQGAKTKRYKFYALSY